MTKKGKGFLPSLIRKPPKFLTNIVSKVITGRKTLVQVLKTS